ncbi:hypothetical protein EV361DRAFT_956316 [Lentinula raphanica]|nr:hypothetical protein EV361DRAFT_956316 [Lentinula raphanica]
MASPSSLRNVLIDKTNYLAALNDGIFEWNATLHQHKSTLVDAQTPTKPYVFTIVIKVDNLHSNLLPDGGYTKPSGITPSLSDARITVAGSRPSIEPFKSDFNYALSHLDAILDKKRNPGIGWKASGLTFNNCGDFYGINRKPLTPSTADHVQSNNLENQPYDVYYDKYKGSFGLQQVGR